MKAKNPGHSVEEPLGRLMSKIGRSFMEKLHESLSHLDLERSYYPLLIIEAANGTLTQNQLARELSCDKVQVVRIIDYLSSTGYVERAMDPRDRRKYNLLLTEKAIKFLPDIKKAIEDATAAALNNIATDKVNELYPLLHHIEKNLSH
jgi:DNA-binding MarR family transcriptional regulator